jgi:uncharacterized protein (DUF1697 family)
MPDRHVRYVALLRGINVGRAKRVAMADLRALVAESGYGDVKTLLNSGNVVFSGPRAPARDVAARIERALVERTGVSSRTLVLDAAELETVVRENPLAAVADNPSRLLAALLFDPADASRLAPLTRQSWSPGALAVGSRAAYLWCPDGISASPLPDALYGAATHELTMRNWATITKLRSMVGVRSCHTRGQVSFGTGQHTNSGRSTT